MQNRLTIESKLGGAKSSARHVHNSIGNSRVIKRRGYTKRGASDERPCFYEAVPHADEQDGTDEIFNHRSPKKDSSVPVLVTMLGVLPLLVSISRGFDPSAGPITPWASRTSIKRAAREYPIFNLR